MIKQAPILLTGCQRSGTSIIAAVLHHCGAFIGDVTKRSMYENVEIKENIVEPYMQNIITSIHWKEDVEGVIERQGYTEGIWMYKSTGISHIWPIWNDAFPNAKWVIVRRKPSDIINSCMKTKYMTQFKTESGWLSWVRMHEIQFTNMIQSGLNCKIIWPERLIQGDDAQLRELIEWVGLSWKDDVLDVIDPLLWKTKIERSKV